MQILMFDTESTEYDAWDIAVRAVTVATPLVGDRVNDAAETVRATFSLTADHRSAIAAWLGGARDGDILLLPRVYSETYPNTDDIALVLLSESRKPTISRMVLKTKTVVETSVAVEKLPASKKTSTRAKADRAKKKKAAT